MDTWARRLKVAALAALLALLVPSSALAVVKFLPPLTDKGDGSVECTNCCTGSSLTSGSLIVGGGSSAISALANNGTATVMYATNASGYNSGNPGWRAPLLGDITTPAASSVLAGILSDETGGTSKVVFDTNPTIAGITITGTVAGGGSTAPWQLPDGAIGVLADIDAAIRKGTANSTKLATSTSAAVTTNNCAKWDADGNLVDSGGACGSTAYSVHNLDFSPITKLTVTDATDVFCGFDGSCSTTSDGADVQTPFDGSGTFESIDCRATGTTGTAITVNLDFGTCGAALTDGTAQAVMATSAWGAPTSKTGSSAFTDEQCGVFKFSTSGADATAGLIVRCSVKRTAGAA